MQYKIGKIAKIMGVTPEAIRHYERLGLIIPFKDPDTNYVTIQMNKSISCSIYSGSHTWDITV